MPDRHPSRPNAGGAATPLARHLWPALVALAALAVALGLTLQAWRAARQGEEAERRAAFDFHVRDARSRVLQRMLAYEQVLRGAAGLFAASPSVEQKGFSDYVRALDLERTYPGVQGLGFGQAVGERRLAALLAERRRDGSPGYAVWPPGPRQDYAPVLFLEPPTARNRVALGFDMASEPVRQAALVQARDSGLPTLTGRLRLVTEPSAGPQPGVLLYLPVYRPGAHPATLEARRAAHLGWVYASFRMTDLLVGILGEGAEGLDLELFDGDTTAPDALLYDADPAHDAGAARGASRAVEALDLGGRRWTMVLDEAQATGSRPLPRSTLLALAGLSASLVLALALWLLGAGRVRAEAQLEERRLAAEALETAHRFVQATLDALPEQLCVLDAAGTILAVNRAWRTFGQANGARADGTNEGASYLQVCDQAALAGDASAARFAEGLRAVLSGRASTFATEYACHGPTAERWFLARASRFAGEEPVRVVLSHQDVSERMAAERAMREGEERLRVAAAAAGQVEWLFDLETGAGEFGEGWTRLTGWPLPAPASMAGVAELVHADEVEAMLARFRACTEGPDGRVDAEFRLRTASGTWRWMRTRGQVTARDPAGRPLRLAGTLADVEERHALQEQLLGATRLASVGTLAAGVAHEINNPLAWMHANLGLGLELLDARGPLDEPAHRELRQLVAEALEGAERIAAVVKAMRSLGRPDRPEAARPLDVRTELLHAVQMVRNQLQQRAELTLDLSDELPAVRARTSELGRVFLNLLLNAAHAVGETGARGHRIMVRARQQGGEVLVEVSDSGPGIPAGVRQRIFEPFFTTKPVGQGTGLGLSIARSIVDAAGGRIELEAGEGHDTTFRVRLPVLVEPSAAPEAAAPPAAAASAPSRRRVLVVDDEPLVARSLQRQLERHHEVTILANAEEALHRLASGERWDALLVDIMMPGLDGPALHQALAERHPELLPRLAFITGGVFGERAAGFLAVHQVPVLPKPFEPPALQAMVERLATA